MKGPADPWTRAPSLSNDKDRQNHKKEMTTRKYTAYGQVDEKLPQKKRDGDAK